MANVQKYTASQAGGMTRHYERHQKENGEYQTFGNQDIDVSRIHLNYNLAPERKGIGQESGQLGFINQRISEVKCLKRSDVNVMCSWIITAPEGLATGIEQRAGQRPLLKFEGDEAEKNLRLFFEESYKFLNERYAHGSDKNVISAYVHMDETTPHMHYAFVPVVIDKKKGHEKVSASELINRYDLKRFHLDLEKHMAVIFGREIGILNEATKDGNRTVEELKSGSAQAELYKIQNNTSSLRLERNELQDEVLYLEGKKDKLEGQINAAEGQARLRHQELTELQNDISNLRSLEISIKNELKDTVSEVNSLEIQKDELLDELVEISEQIKSSKHELKELAGNLEGKIKTKVGIDAVNERASLSMFGSSVKLSKDDFDNLIKTALTSPRVETAEKLRKADAKIEELQPLAERVPPLERLVNELRSTIKKKDELIHEKDINIQGITQVKDRTIRDLNYKIGRMEEDKTNALEAMTDKINRVLGKIDDMAANDFIREWELDVVVKQRGRGYGWER